MRLPILAFLILLMQIAALGQSQPRVITAPECPYEDDEVLLEVSNLRIGDREVSFDERFVAGDDWLARLVFRVVNKGQKPIAAIVMLFGLLEGVDEELPAYASYSYGLQFIRANMVSNKKAKSKLFTLVEPGKEIEITATGAKPYGLEFMDAIIGGKTRSNQWIDFATKAGPRFHRANVKGAIVYYTDGTEVDGKLRVAKCK